MDLATIIGLVLAWGAFFGSVIMEGGELKAMINPSAAVLVFGGTLGASMMSFPLSAIIGLPGVVKNAFMGKKEDVGAHDQDAGRLRREGPARGPAGAGR